MARVHFLTFGDGSPQFRGAAARLQREAASARIFATAERYDLRRLRDEYPEFWAQHGRLFLNAQTRMGYFLWKPFLISARLSAMSENDFLVYIDAGCEILPGNMHELMDWLPTEPGLDVSAVPLEDAHSTVRWTHGCCLAHLDPANKYLSRPMIAATFMFLRNTNASRNLAAKWLEWSVFDDYSCLRSRPGDQERPEFQEHRWDQSIFNLLLQELEARGAIGLKRIGVERTRSAGAAIQGLRNRTPFRSIGVNRWQRKIMNKAYNAAVRLFWNEQKYQSDLRRSLPKQ